MWDNSSTRNLCDSFDENGVLFETSSFSDELNHTILSVVYLNRAPVLTNSSPVLRHILEDISSFNNVGNTIRDVLFEIVNDVDDIDIGIAVTAFESSFGIWETSLSGNQSEWEPLPFNISRASPLLLVPDCRIRLVYY